MIHLRVKALSVESICSDLMLSVDPKDCIAAIAGVWLRLFTRTFSQDESFTHETYKHTAQV